MIDYNKIACEYGKHRQVHPEVLRGLLFAGAIGRASRVLEVGCGTGNYIRALQQASGGSCWGIDPSRDILARARKRPSKVNFQLGRAERLDFPQDFFDLVFSVDVIHHLRDRAEYFQEAYRVLKADGKLCTVTDSEWIIRHRRPLSAYFPETVEADLARYPRIAELRESITRVRFVDIAEDTVEFAYELTDAGAYYDKAFSSLHLIPEDAFQKGIDRMAQDLNRRPIQCVSRYLLLWGTK